MALLDVQLPNAATWVFLSFLLTVAVFFQFGRPFATRNRDVLGLFLFAPGFLHLQRAHAMTVADSSLGTLEAADAVRGLAYAWLLAAAFLWFVRCVLDFVMTRRPAVVPNLALPAIVWLGVAVLVGHLASAILRPGDPWEPVGRRPAAVVGVESGAAALGAAATGQPATTTTRAAVSAAFAAGGHLAILAALGVIGRHHFSSPATGLAMAFAYVLVPYTGFQFAAFHLVLPAALVLWAVVAFRSSWASGGLLGLAAGMAFFPALLLPAWLQFYRGRGAGRFAVWFAFGLLAGAAITVFGLWALGSSPAAAWRAANPGDWIPWRKPLSESIWTGTHWAYRLPVFVLYAAYVGVNVVWPATRDFGQLVATSASVLLGVQFWYADQGGMYVLWFLPLLIVMAFRPTATDLQPPADAGTFWFGLTPRAPGPAVPS
jgi:hypothetical protein